MIATIIKILKWLLLLVTCVPSSILCELYRVAKMTSYLSAPKTAATYVKTQLTRRSIVTTMVIITGMLLTERVCYIPKSLRLTPMQRAKRYVRNCARPVATRIDAYRWRRLKRKYGLVDCFETKAQDKDGLATKEHAVKFDTDAAPIGIDNRCSGCISHVSSDFVGELKQSNRGIKGFGGITTMNVMIGTLVWRWCDDDGREHKFIIPNSFYVPQGGIRLLSPQHWAQAQRTSKRREETGEWTGSKACVLHWGDGKRKKFARTVELDVKGANLATFDLAPSYSSFAAFCSEIGITKENGGDTMYDAQPIVCEPVEVVTDDEDEPMTPQSRNLDKDHGDTGKFSTEQAESQREFNLAGPNSEEERAQAPVVIVDEEDRVSDKITNTSNLLLYHYRYQHMSFPKLQLMAKQGVLPRNLANCNVPVCSACAYAKATKRPWRSKSRKPEDEPGEKSNPQPGDVVSVDQLVSPVPGLIAQMVGFITKERYRYVTVFVDQATKLGYVYLQKTSTAEETIEAKEAFELYCADRGVKVKAYHADNGIFKAKKWSDACRMSMQPLTFAGVNAHHQNGLAERRIRELQELTRSSLIHANRRWPSAVTTNLWPYALRMANHAYNSAPSMQDKKRRTPDQIFTNSGNVHVNRKHWKPFGCPVYPLDEKLQANKPFGKWDDRSKIGIYLGQSPIHNHSVALVLNIKTGHVSPQFHISFDPSFHTVSQQPDLDIRWMDATRFRDSRDKQVVRRLKRQKDANTQGSKRRRKSALSVGNILSNGIEGVSTPQITDVTHNTTQDKARTNEPTLTNLAPEDAGKEKANGNQDSTEQPEREQVHRTRSGRVSRPASRLLEIMQSEIMQLSSGNVPGEIFSFGVLCPKGTSKMENPLEIFKASSDPDTMYMHEAMREPDHLEFSKAMEKEVKDQMENGNFTVVHKSEVPEGVRILPTVWQMKRKRDIRTRKITKYKARLNIDGSKQEYGVHYTQTYAPVASWMSVKLLLALTALHDWHTTQIDYVLAFPQAPVEKELYMHCPRGFKFGDVESPKDYVLRLNRNVYGQKQAGRVWNQYLTKRLVEKVGFKQSKVDECIFYRGSVIYVLYTDDSILAGPDKAEIDDAIRAIKAAKLDITVEGDIKDFLGVNITKKNGKITFTQPHLITKILGALGMDNDKVKSTATPARCSVLISRHSDSEAFGRSFNYRSVIGMLGYLETTRSDISYATHQCARFSSDPKVEHEKAIRHLGRYLKGTRDEGTTFTPDLTKGLEVYVDADFMGNWDPKEAANDRDTARSRHGYIICYAGCPIVTKSQLQTEICLSTTESEYTGLSYALREAIPIMRLLDEMKENGVPVTSSNTTVKCRVYEDNSGALEIAKNPKYRPRTKHLNGRLHHFRSWVESGRVAIEKIHTTEQRADYLTKAVPEEILVHLRGQVMGW